MIDLEAIETRQRRRLIVDDHTRKGGACEQSEEDITALISELKSQRKRPTHCPGCPECMGKGPAPELPL